MPTAADPLLDAATKAGGGARKNNNETKGKNEVKKYEQHELGTLLPEMDPVEFEKHKASIEKDGLIEPIILLDGKILDGFHRYRACGELGIEGRFAPFESLTPLIRKSGPLEYVLARNLYRRHLDAGQKAAIAVDSEPFFAAQAKERQSAGGGSAPKGATRDETSQDTGHDAASESQAPTKKKAAPEKKGKALAAAAKATGASTRSAERAKALKKKDPKKFAAVKAGREKLGKAAKDASKEAQKKAELADALKKIANIAGKDTAAVMEKRKRTEIMEMAAMSESDIIKVRGLINSGFTLAKARKYKMTALGRTHSIGDLCTRALAQNVAKSGSYDLDITHEGVALHIAVTKGKAAPAKK